MKVQVIILRLNGFVKLVVAHNYNPSKSLGLILAVKKKGD
jgi:hypothetical protein